MNIETDLLWNTDGTRLWLIVSQDGLTRAYELTGDITVTWDHRNG